MPCNVIGGFSSWDANNNGIYGEWKGENAQDKDIDLRPDVYVGRLACRNKFEVFKMVNKIINYEKTPHKNELWFKRMIVAGGITFCNLSGPGHEGEEPRRIRGFGLGLGHRWYLGDSGFERSILITMTFY